MKRSIAILDAMFDKHDRRGLGPRLFFRNLRFSTLPRQNRVARQYTRLRSAAGLIAVVALQLGNVSSSLAEQSLSLEMDGEQHGVFSGMTQARDDADTVTLEQGWIASAFLDTWWPGLMADGELQEGRHQFEGECIGRRLEVVQVLATGQRSRVRSWTLVDACPVWFQVESQEGDKIKITALTLRVRGIAVAQ